MRSFMLVAILLAPTAALAEEFERPIPQAQTAQAELSYLVAALLLLGALIAVQWLVSRK
jgi:hypothetical protein